jgi:hypothetical protein
VISKLNSGAAWAEFFYAFRLRQPIAAVSLRREWLRRTSRRLFPAVPPIKCVILESEGGSAIGYCLFLEHPMPRFVDKAVRVIADTRHHEPEFFGIGSEPAECCRVFEVFGQGRMVWCSDVDSQAGVMLAEARSSNYGKNRVQRHPLGELALNDLGLMIDAAKAGDDQ